MDEPNKKSGEIDDTISPKKERKYNYHGKYIDVSKIHFSPRTPDPEKSSSSMDFFDDEDFENEFFNELSPSPSPEKRISSPEFKDDKNEEKNSLKRVKSSNNSYLFDGSIDTEFQMLNSELNFTNDYDDFETPKKEQEEVKYIPIITNKIESAKKKSEIEPKENNEEDDFYFGDDHDEDDLNEMEIFDIESESYNDRIAKITFSEPQNTIPMKSIPPLPPQKSLENSKQIERKEKEKKKSIKLDEVDDEFFFGNESKDDHNEYKSELDNEIPLNTIHIKNDSISNKEITSISSSECDDEIKIIKKKKNKNKNITIKEDKEGYIQYYDNDTERNKEHEEDIFNYMQPIKKFEDLEAERERKREREIYNMRKREKKRNLKIRTKNKDFSIKRSRKVYNNNENNKRNKNKKCKNRKENYNKKRSKVQSNYAKLCKGTKGFYDDNININLLVDIKGKSNSIESKKIEKMLKERKKIERMLKLHGFPELIVVLDTNVFADASLEDLAIIVLSYFVKVTYIPFLVLEEIDYQFKKKNDKRGRKMTWKWKRAIRFLENAIKTNRSNIVIEEFSKAHYMHAGSVEQRMRKETLVNNDTLIIDAVSKKFLSGNVKNRRLIFVSRDLLFRLKARSLQVDVVSSVEEIITKYKLTSVERFKM